ncbi:MAG TPA: RNA 2',3'-cyclic phosphodiesterase [Terracidiphilus sp.]|nr:RNA 2',3'-cyclic phosphodiesterase [Terracidiphilus sp.]
MRLFIGIPMAGAVVNQLAEVRARLERPGDGLRWSAPESWHITLQFLGAATPAQYDRVVEHLGALREDPVPVQLEGMGSFERSGVFFAGVRLSPELIALQKSVVAATSQCGFRAEERPYHPHITLARNRGREDGVRGLKPRVGPAPQFAAFTAAEFLLYESFPHATGSRYEVRARFALGEGPAAAK